MHRLVSSVLRTGVVLGLTLAHLSYGEGANMGPAVAMDGPQTQKSFPIFENGRAAAVCVSHDDLAPVLKAVNVFQSDVEKLSGQAPRALPQGACAREPKILIVGSLGHSEMLARLIREHRLDTTAIQGKWESAIVQQVENPLPGVKAALVVAGSDARGTAYALYDLSRAMGVSPWNWWADVPVVRHSSARVLQQRYIQTSPAVQYRGIFINDEDWGMRPWAARKMDPELNNIGPKTYTRIFELLLRLHANTLWPAMHPGSMPFHQIAENTKLAEQWGIVMGSSHSEALLRNNVGEWDLKRDGPWNYQTNRDAIYRYWDERAKANGKFENFYTVGMRGQHDSGLEATGSTEVKASLVEQVMSDQRKILAGRVDPDLAKVPQVIWLYKESINLYRAGMKVPDDVTLGWTDDNYGYLRQLPTRAEQQRPGGSALYYHVSYWGAPHDYLWVASTPPALMREELTKAWDHGVRKLWILNVGDLKPAEEDIDYFLRLAWRAPDFREAAQPQFLTSWFAEQFPPAFSSRLAAIAEQFYHLNFIRRPEFMGFNGYNDQVRRTAFNPLAWGDQNRQRLDAWDSLDRETKALEREIPAQYQDAYFELVAYPVEASAAQNRKFLWTDRSYVDQHARNFIEVDRDAKEAKAAFEDIQELTAHYNGLAGGKWESMMSWHPRDRHVFELPAAASHTATGSDPLPENWSAGATQLWGTQAHENTELNQTISLDATHFKSKIENGGNRWKVWPDLGLSNGSIGIAHPGDAMDAAWVNAPGDGTAASEIAKSSSLEYAFTVTTGGEATATIALLPTFPLDADHRLRYALALDGGTPEVLDAAGSEEHKPGLTDWSSNVLSNAAFQRVPLRRLAPGRHTLKLFYGEPGVIFEHITITFPGAPPAYPFPPEAIAP